MARRRSVEARARGHVRAPDRCVRCGCRPGWLRRSRSPARGAPDARTCAPHTSSAVGGAASSMYCAISQRARAWPPAEVRLGVVTACAVRRSSCGYLCDAGGRRTSECCSSWARAHRGAARAADSRRGHGDADSRSLTAIIGPNGSGKARCSAYSQECGRSRMAQSHSTRTHLANAVARRRSPTVLSAQETHCDFAFTVRRNRRDGPSPPSGTVAAENVHDREAVHDALTTCDLLTSERGTLPACRGRAPTRRARAVSPRSQTFCCWTSRPHTLISSTPCPC